MGKKPSHATVPLTSSCQVIQSLTLIVSFMPAISALSGNLGLQASANTIRGLGTGHIPASKYCSNITKEVSNILKMPCCLKALCHEMNFFEEVLSVQFFHFCVDEKIKLKVLASTSKYCSNITKEVSKHLIYAMLFKGVVSRDEFF